jgi:hypothetical protein
MKELLEKRVSEARATSTNSARHISMEAFIGILSGLLTEIEQHHTLSANYGLVPRSTASSGKDSSKSKQGWGQGFKVHVLLRLWRHISQSR